jgi:hypothetical protein
VVKLPVKVTCCPAATARQLGLKALPKLAPPKLMVLDALAPVASVKLVQPLTADGVFELVLPPQETRTATEAVIANTTESFMKSPSSNSPSLF